MVPRFLLEFINRRLNEVHNDDDDSLINHVIRILAKDDYNTLDYSIFGVAFMTLGLLLMVELIRHRLDVVAAHRPFLKAILSAVYQECECLFVRNLMK